LFVSCKNVTGFVVTLVVTYCIQKQTAYNLMMLVYIMIAN